MMNPDAVLQVGTTKCPKCSSTNLRRSRWHRDDRRRSRLKWSPYRCMDCGNRFLRLSRRVVSYLGVASVLALIVAAIAFAIYAMTSMDRPIAQPASPQSATLPANAEKVPEPAAAQAVIEGGDANSQYERGMRYFSGEGEAAKNPAEALKWLELAANQGHADARYKLGILYRTGLGVLQNFETAFQWFELAAKQNHADAQYDIGLMHKNGQSVPVDFVKAYVWLNLAAAQGHVGARGARDGVLQVMTAQQVAEGQRASRDWRPVSNSTEKQQESTQQSKGVDSKQ